MSRKMSITVTPIYAKPKNFPVNKLKKLDKDLTRYLQREAGPMIKRDMEATTVTWRGAPVFVVKYSETSVAKRVDIFPTGPNTLKWKRVSEGTPPRVIQAKPGSMMIFPKNYAPKTTAGGQYGGPGRKYGPMVKAKAVMHQIEPRKFTLVIKNKRQKQILSDIQKIVWSV